MLSDFRQHFFLTVTNQDTINKLGICHLGIVPVRAEPTSKSEQVTQLLFGETYQVNKVSPDGKFVWITTDYDQYSGWIEASRWEEVSVDFYQKAKTDQGLVLTQPVTTLKAKPYTFLLSFGATLPLLNEGELFWEGKVFLLEGEIAQRQYNVQRLDIMQWALMFLGTPYLWGGKSIFGIDCSAFTQLVFKAGKYFLPRDAYQQQALGSNVLNIEEAKTGDLAFFARKGNIIHVGIVLTISDIHQNNPSYAHQLTQMLASLKKQQLEAYPVLDKPYQWIIHAYDCVRIDIIDQVGIYNLNEKQYTHYTHSIKQIIDSSNRSS